MPRRSYFRQIAAPIVERLLREYRKRPASELRRAIRAAYPFVERRSWRYRVWLDEIHRQRTGHAPDSKHVERPREHPGQKRFFPVAAVPRFRRHPRDR